MGTIAQKLANVATAKSNIATAITNKGGTVPTKFVDFGTAIANLPTGTNKAASIVDKSITTLTASDLNGASEIGDYAFYQCSALTSVTIPSGITSIGEKAFFECGVTSLTFSDASSVTSIGMSAFEGCLIENDLTFDYQNGDLEIGDQAFLGLDPSNKITITGASYEDISNMSNYPFGASTYNQVYGDLSETSVVSQNGSGSTIFSANIVGQLTGDWMEAVVGDLSEQIVIGDAITEIPDDIDGAGELGSFFGSIVFRGRDDVSSWDNYPWGFDPSNIHYTNS